MKNGLYRIVALLLVPCLLAAPLQAFSTSAWTGHSACPMGRGDFQAQSLELPLAFARRSLQAFDRGEARGQGAVQVRRVLAAPPTGLQNSTSLWVGFRISRRSLVALTALTGLFLSGGSHIVAGWQQDRGSAASIHSGQGRGAPIRSPRNLYSRITAALQTQDASDLIQVIKTRDGLDALLQLCDQSALETAIADELTKVFEQMIEASTPVASAERQAVRRALLGVLRTTDQLEIALLLSTGLLDEALTDVRRNAAPAPDRLFGEIKLNAVNKKLISQAVVVGAGALSTDADPNQLAFLNEIADLAEPAVSHSFSALTTPRPAPVNPPAVQPIKEPALHSPSFLRRMFTNMAKLLAGVVLLAILFAAVSYIKFGRHLVVFLAAGGWLANVLSPGSGRPAQRGSPSSLSRTA